MTCVRLEVDGEIILVTLKPGLTEADLLDEERDLLAEMVRRQRARRNSDA